MSMTPITEQKDATTQRPIDDQTLHWSDIIANVPAPYQAQLAKPAAQQAMTALHNEIFLKFGNQPFGLSIASSAPQEGKSFVSLMLALHDFQHLPVQPSLIIDTSDNTALASAFLAKKQSNVTDRAPSTDPCCHIFNSGIPGLDICQTRTDPLAPPVLPYTLLTKLQTLIGIQYHRIIIDTPCARDSKTYAAVAKIFGATLLVARYGQTRHEQLRAMTATLEEGNTTVVGCFLNRRRMPLPRWLYGH